MGEHDEAVKLYERALSITEASFGPEHPRTAAILNNLANVHMARGDASAARALYERALSINERTLGPDHPDVAMGLCNVAVVESDHAKAEALLERALAIQEKSLGPQHPELARPLALLAEIATDQGRHREAIALAERVLSVVEDAGIAPIKVAKARDRLATLLWNAPEAQGRDRPRALELAHRAVAEYRAVGGHEQQVEALEAWAQASTPQTNTP